MGGRIKSVQFGKISFEMGSQFFCKSDKNILKILSKKKLTDQLINLDFSNLSFYNKNNFYNDPDEIMKTIEYVLKKYSKTKPKENTYFDQWYTKNFGTDRLFIPKGIIRAITFSDSKDVLVDYGIYILSTFFDECFTLQGGLQIITDSLGRGGYFTKMDIDTIHFSKDEAKFLISKRKKILLTKDFVISSIPPGQVKISGNEKLKEALGKINFTSCIVIIFEMKKKFTTREDYIFFSNPKSKISVIERFELEDTQFIGCLIPHRKIYERGFALDYSKKLLNKIYGKDFRDNISRPYFEDWIPGMPNVNIDYKKGIETLGKMNFKNIVFAGDYTMKHPSMDSAALSGEKAADTLLEKYGI